MDRMAGGGEKLGIGGEGKGRTWKGMSGEVEDGRGSWIVWGVLRGKEWEEQLKMEERLGCVERVGGF